MISVEQLNVEFGTRPLFHDVSYVINDHDRIALVGKNGAGKSTMLKIICGMQKPTSGTIGIPNECEIGYLPQVMKLSDDTTVIEETRKAFSGRNKMQEELKKMEQEMADRTDYDSDSYMQLVERFTQEHERFQLMGGENYEADIERTLTGLGFDRTDFDRPTREFSGGWRMRIELAKILLRKPDVLLLDEPTNHLDIESIQWLEQFILNSPAALLLVSHDRAFINNITNRTIEITCGHIEDYKVPYDKYLVLRQERREQQIRAWQNQQKEIADAKAFIDRFRYQATKAVQVQQKVRQLEKIVPIEIDEVDNKVMHLKFPPCLRSGDYPVICDDVEKAYGNHTIFSHVNLTIKRGEKVAFVGKNGEGKSTLVKCIMGEIPFAGKLKIGHNVEIGYFAQNQAQMLDESLSIYDTIDEVATGDMRLKINDLLGAFMFGGEVSEKKVKVLSGGERSRLAMIRLLLEPVNLLILDEPTNHLDMPSKDVLKEAIKAFDGTAIIVSHDRDFLDGLVSKVFEFGGGKVKEHLGGVYDWIRSQNNAETVSLSKSASVAETPVKPAESPTTEQVERVESYAEHKERQKKMSKVKKAIADAEKKVKVLSGGERSRLAMIRLLLEPVNLLILDEPTNHLDMPSKDVLKEAIKAFDGTAIIVSHDRDFLDGLVSKVFEFGGGKVKEHLGGVYDWIRSQNNAETVSLSKSASVAETPVKPAESPTTEQVERVESYAEHKERQKKMSKVKKAIADAEKKIAEMESRLKELDTLLMDPKNACDMKLVTEYTTTKDALDKENDRWMELSEQLEEL